MYPVCFLDLQHTRVFYVRCWLNGLVVIKKNTPSDTALCMVRLFHPAYSSLKNVGKKVFSGKTVHTVHLVFLLFIFIMLVGEYSVNSEHFTVHSGRYAGKKRPAVAGPGRLCRGGFIALRQPVGVAFLPEREIGLHALICAAFIVIQTVFFQHG